MINKRSETKNFFSLLAIIMLGCLVAYGATFKSATSKSSLKKNSLLKDTIIIIKANELSLVQEEDGNSLQIAEGDVIAKQGNTIFKANKAIKNNTLNTFEAWGNVHITESDTTHIHSDHLKYVGNTQVADLDGNVKLTDGQVVLTTPSLTHDMATKISTYKKGGKVVNNKTVITSKEGEYYSDIKDVYFYKDVVVNDPAYNITADSLQYNTNSRIATFISMTHIKDSARRTIDTKEGFYNLGTGEAQFGQRPFINDDNKSTLEADNVYLDSTIAKAVGNAVAVDSVQGTIIIANTIFQNRLNEAILATQKPVMIIKQDTDSLYVAADTLFSARLSDLFVPASEIIDTTTFLENDSTIIPENIPQVIDSLTNQIEDVADSAKNLIEKNIPKTDSNSFSNVLKRSILKNDTIKNPIDEDILENDSIASQNEIDTTKKDSIIDLTKKNARIIAEDTTVRTKGNSDSTDRYFEAFHNVRIYSDSMQAVSDSLFYSFRDSTFRLYKEPVVWGKESQITGDTILLHTKNKKPHWMEAFKNGFMVSYVDKEAYNQIKASRIDAYFVDGQLDSVRAKGSAETIYFLQDDDSAFTGINQATSDIMDTYFKNKQLHKVVFRSEVNGTIYPIRQKSPTEMRLEGFIWREGLRPKSKYELFE